MTSLVSKVLPSTSDTVKIVSGIVILSLVPGAQWLPYAYAGWKIYRTISENSETIRLAYGAFHTTYKYFRAPVEKNTPEENV